jgi:hypothetical protein
MDRAEWLFPETGLNRCHPRTIKSLRRDVAKQGGHGEKTYWANGVPMLHWPGNVRDAASQHSKFLGVQRPIQAALS